MTTTASRLESKGRLLSLYGLTRAPTKMARFYDDGGRVLAELPVTAKEFWLRGLVDILLHIRPTLTKQLHPMTWILFDPPRFDLSQL